MQRAGQAVGVLDQPVVLGAGAGDANSVGLLERVRADHEGRHLTGQNDQRDRVQKRIREAGHRIGGAGAGCHQHNAGLAGGAGIAFGGVHRALLVPHQNVADVILQKDLVINRQHGAAWVSEDHVHTLILQGLDNHLCAGHFTCHLLFAPIGGIVHYA